MFTFDISKLQWTHPPKTFSISQDLITITTEPKTDLWQRTYYNFRNDNAPLLQLPTTNKSFSFQVKVNFAYSKRFDQAGIVIYLNSENWVKISVEAENDKMNHLGVVVTNNGYSDWSVSEIDASVKEMWFRLSRRGSDFCAENSREGKCFSLMRIFHMFEGGEEIRFGVFACSPEDGSFKAEFRDFEVLENQWKDHDGQQPDKE